MPNASYAYFDGIKGSCTQDGRKDSVLVLSLDHTVEIPVDVKDATATGSRVHGAMELVCNIDAATPQLYECVSNSTEIKTVQIQYWHIDETGKEVNYFNINMEGVRIVKIKNWFPNIDDAATASYKDMINYSLRYNTIEWEYTDGNKSHKDEWQKPNM